MNLMLMAVLQLFLVMALPVAFAEDFAISTLNGRTLSKMQETGFTWEPAIRTAPAVVCVLGELMALSYTQDFSINEGKPKGGFKYVRYPQSFSTTLRQLAAEGWQAFKTADDSMLKIHLRVKGVRRKISTILKYANRGSVRLIKRLLPRQLEKLKKVGLDNAKDAKAVADVFGGVQKFIQEVVGSTTSARRELSIDMSATNAEIKTSTEMLKAHKAALKLYEKKEKDNDKKLEDLTSTFFESVEKIPGGWKQLAMDYTSFGIKLVATAVKIWTKPLRMWNNNDNGKKNKVQTTPKSDDNNTLTKSQSQQIQNPLIFQCVEFAQKYVIAAKENLTFFRSGKGGNQKTPEQTFKNLVVAIEIVKTDIDNIDATPVIKTQVMNIIKKGADICKELSNSFQSLTNETAKEFHGRLDQLLRETKPFVSGAQAYGNNVGDDEAWNTNIKDAARFKAYASYKNLENMMKHADENIKKQDQMHEAVSQKMGEMIRLNYTKLTQEAIEKVMVEGIKRLSEMKEKWETLSMFFKELAEECDRSFAVEALARTLNITSRNLIVKASIEGEANQLNANAEELRLVTGAYLTVSRKYVLDRLSALPRLLNVKDKRQQQKLVQKVKQDTKDADEGINKYFNDVIHNPYRLALQAERERQRKKVEELGGISQEDKDAVEKGQKMLSMDDISSGI